AQEEAPASTDPAWSKPSCGTIRSGVNLGAPGPQAPEVRRPWPGPGASSWRPPRPVLAEMTAGGSGLSLEYLAGLGAPFAAPGPAEAARGLAADACSEGSAGHGGGAAGPPQGGGRPGPAAGAGAAGAAGAAGCAAAPLTFERLASGPVAGGSGLGVLRVDASRARLGNPEQQTSEGDRRLLDEGLQGCMRALADHGFLGGARGPGPVYLSLHPPVYTCEQAERLCQAPASGAPETKNLFVKDKKKNLFLISALVGTDIKLGKLRLKGMASGGASFASNDVLFDVLRLIPGSVTPFGLINDSPAKLGQGPDGNAILPRVTFYLDANALRHEYLAFHPNACHATLEMPRSMFIDFIENVTGHEVNILESPGQ
ncbi:unnamed protein product, partial [Prorocentrum cordatum]